MLHWVTFKERDQGTLAHIQRSLKGHIQDLCIEGQNGTCPSCRLQGTQMSEPSTPLLGLGLGLGPGPFPATVQQEPLLPTWCGSSPAPPTLPLLARPGIPQYGSSQPRHLRPDPPPWDPLDQAGPLPTISSPQPEQSGLLSLKTPPERK